MRRRDLQVRDLEIVRTLGRLRYMTTREINSVFFGTERNGRRRLKILRDLDLIRPHVRGIPPRVLYSAWRLTVAGVRLIAEAFPDEPVVDGLAERIAAGHLGQVDHREAVSRVYLELLAGNRDEVDETDLASVRARAVWIRDRASQVWWQADGDVILPVRSLGEAKQLVPDATLCGRHRSGRVFVEVDRSTYALSRLAATFDRYRVFFRDGYSGAFPDRRTPVLLFVVRSKGRQRSVYELAARHLGDVVPWGVLLEGQTTAFLEERLFDTSQMAPSAVRTPVSGEDAPLRAVAKDLYRWVRAFQEELRVEGRELPADGRSLLRRLYEELQTRGGEADHAA